MTQPDTELDPITVEVVRNKLEGIANEMQQTLLRSSFSPIRGPSAGLVAPPRALPRGPVTPFSRGAPMGRRAVPRTLPLEGSEYGM